MLINIEPRREYAHFATRGSEPVLVSSTFFSRHRAWIPVAPVGMVNASEGSFLLLPGTIARVPFEWWDTEIGGFYKGELVEVPEAEFLVLASSATHEVTGDAVQESEAETLDVGEQPGDGEEVGGENPAQPPSPRKRGRKA